MGRWLPALLSFMIVSACAVQAQAQAQDNPQSISQFRHTRWTDAEEGPSRIIAMEQAPNGFLWMATGDGLTRFDGVRFEHFNGDPDAAAERGSPRSLLTRRNGDVWVGLRGFGGVWALRNGRLVDTDMPEPPLEVTDLAEGLDGTVWAATARVTDPLRRYARGRWETLDSSWGVSEGWVFDILVARDGAVWIAMLDKVLVLPRGARRFIATSATVVQGAGLAEDANGRIWLADRQGARRLPDYLRGDTDQESQPVYEIPDISRARIRFAPDGALWGTTKTAGVFRIRSPDANGAVTRYGAIDGLSGDEAAEVVVDREGTVWIGGAGLDSFVSTGLVKDETIPASPAGYRLAVDGRGNVYAGVEQTVFIIRRGQSPESMGPIPFEGLCGGRDGAVWIATANVLRRVVDGRFGRSIPVDSRTVSCGEDRTGRLWRIGDNRALSVYDNGAWRDMTDLLPQGEDRPWNVTIDGEGNPVINLDRREIIRFNGLRPSRLSNAYLGVGKSISLIQSGPSGLFVAGTTGLARIRGNRIQRLPIRDHPWLCGLTSISWTADGEPWLMSCDGLVRVSAADLDRAFDDPARPVAHVSRDDLPGLGAIGRSTDGLQAAIGGDGRFWFLTGGGVMRIQPQGLNRNPLAPPVVIQTVVTRGRTYDAALPVILPKGTRNLLISYSALSLRTPTRVRFRYKLNGVDPDWVDAGVRREATYTNLGPGQHRFRVIAANEDGVWNETGATLDFEIPRTFTQTWLFYVLCGLALAAFTWWLFTLRMRAVAARIRASMTDRLSERERIARELHDTLLQGVQGLILRLQLVAEDLPAAQSAKAALESALDDADEVVGQARDRVRDLRMAANDGDLQSALRKLLDDRFALELPAISLEVEGRERKLNYAVCDEIVQIVAEAVFNARRHAAPTRIVVRTVYRPWTLAVSVRDDGVGILPEVLHHGRSGHFGLRGMGERAHSIGGRLVVDSGADRGTTVTLELSKPARYLSAFLTAVSRQRGKRHD